MRLNSPPSLARISSPCCCSSMHTGKLKSSRMRCDPHRAHVQTPPPPPPPCARTHTHVLYARIHTDLHCTLTTQTQQASRTHSFSTRAPGCCSGTRGGLATAWPRACTRCCRWIAASSSSSSNFFREEIFEPTHSKCTHNLIAMFRVGTVPTSIVHNSEESTCDAGRRAAAGDMHPPAAVLHFV